MGDATKRSAEFQEQAVELDDLTIVVGNGKHAILALRRKGENQVEAFQIAKEQFRIVCSEFLETTSVEELRKIRDQLSRTERAVPLSTEIAVDLFGMLEARYRLPKREKE